MRHSVGVVSKLRTDFLLMKNIEKHVPKLTVERLSPVPLKTVSPCAHLELVELLLLPSTGLKESPTLISRRFPPAVSSMNIFWASVVQRKHEPLGGSSS